MKNKGFTLVELLAILGILAIITLLTVPAIDSTVKRNKDKLYKQQVETIRNGLKTWGDANVDKLPEDSGDILTLNLGYIKAEGFIKPDLVNPKNKQCYANDIKLYIKRVNENYEYIVDFESGSEATEYDCNAGDLIYTDTILNGADPVLSDNLIPVTIEDNGTVKRADIYSEWYNYGEKKWANAVFLTSTGKVESDGTILESSIESYFVWIPRYRYKLFDMGNYISSIDNVAINGINKEIEIKFENRLTETSIGTKVGEFHSHPAFQAFDVNGLWVGKFETTGTKNNLSIKPSQLSLRNLNIKSMFELALNYKKDHESHMMKNTEWGAAAYLSLSKYGINKEININNNSAYYTGYSAVVGTFQSNYPGTSGTDASVTLPYNTPTGYLASTTGNITGIYDMSGGVYEYMASYMSGQLSNSGFTIDPVSNYGAKYFDKYSTMSSINNYNQRILGDATGELGPFYYYNDSDHYTRYHNNWFKDHCEFIDSTYPWFYRGGDYYSGVLAGQLNFLRYDGALYNYFGFRMVLAK